MADEPRFDHELDLPELRRRYEEQSLARRRLEREVERLQSMLDAVYDSETFRLGWALTAPWRALRGRSGPPPRPHWSPETNDVGGAIPGSASPPRSASPTLTAADEEEWHRQAVSPGAIGVVMARSAPGLEGAREDERAAVDLGRRLADHGYDVLCRAPDDWYDLPSGARVYLSLLAEPHQIPDPTLVPASVLRVAWVCGKTRCWIDQGMLPLYDLVLCTSLRTADAIREHYSGPIEILRVGVDENGSRAAGFDDLVRPLLDADAPRRRATVVGFSPDYRITNPYQNLLYKELQRRDVATVPVDGPLALLGRPGLDGHQIVFHQHWTAPILGRAGDDAARARELLDRYLTDLDLLAARGGRLVWTIHNVLPHECPNRGLEIELRRALAARADVIHVLGKRTAALVEDLYPLPEERCQVIEHPSFLGVYPSIVDRETARAELGIPLDRRVYLALGQIRPYKGIERLLTAFAAYARKNRKAQLVIAGNPGKFEGAQALLSRCRRSRRTLLIDEHVEDDRLQVLLRASDVVVLPHRRVLNSSLVWLAFTFARPVVAPRTGEVQDVVTSGVGVLFDPEGGSESLLTALREADRLGAVHGRRAFEVALAYPPALAAARFADLVQQLTRAQP